MKLELKIIALCDYGMISQDGKLSVIGVFDEIGVTNFPGGIARACFVATIQGEPETEYKLNVKMIHPEGSKNPLNPLGVDVKTGRNGISNILVQLVNVVFETAGEYKLVLYHGDDRIGSTLFKVFHIKQQYGTNKKPN